VGQQRVDGGIVTQASSSGSVLWRGRFATRQIVCDRAPVARLMAGCLRIPLSPSSSANTPSPALGSSGRVMAGANEMSRQRSRMKALIADWTIPQS
jgi:hypothetical protein